MHCFKNIQQDLMTISRSLVERTDFNRAPDLGKKQLHSTNMLVKSQFWVKYNPQIT